MSEKMSNFVAVNIIRRDPMKLSIITINYNNAEGLRKTLASVASQTFRDFEHIIVDGGSTDESVEIIRQYADNETIRLEGYKAIRQENSNADILASSPHHLITSSPIIWISEPDTGIYNAMNKGLRKAQGEYLLFLNSGDYLVNELILNTVFANNFDEDIVYGNIYVVEQNGRKTLATAPNSEEITFVSIHSKMLFHPASFIKRELMLNIGGYDEEIKITADFAFFVIAICKYNCSLKKIDLPISVFELGGISSTTSEKDKYDEGLYMMKKYFPRFKEDIVNFYSCIKIMNRWPYKHIYKLEKKMIAMKRYINRIYQKK